MVPLVLLGLVLHLLLVVQLGLVGPLGLVLHPPRLSLLVPVGLLDIVLHPLRLRLQPRLRLPGLPVLLVPLAIGGLLDPVIHLLRLSLLALVVLVVPLDPELHPLRLRLQPRLRLPGLTDL